MTWEEFIVEYLYDDNEYGDTSPFLIHFRITSKGATSLDNCHPFKVNDDMAIIHNGTMTNIDIKKGDTRSDTKIFAEEWLPTIGELLLDNIYLYEMAKGFIGYSKVCILHRNRGVFILNEELGFWDKDDDCWYSNKSYMTLPTYKADTYPINKNRGWHYCGGVDKVTEDNWWEEQRKNQKLIPLTSDKTIVIDAEHVGYGACDWCTFGVAKHLCGTWANDKDLCDECYEEYKTIYEDVVCDNCKKEIDTEIYVHPIDVGCITLCKVCLNSDFASIKLEHMRSTRG